jgi:hypothetical protein
MLDGLGIVVIAAVTMVNVNALIGAMPLTRPGQLTLAGGIGVWVGLVIALAARGSFAAVAPLPLIGVFAALPLAAAALLAAFAPAVRTALLGAPMPLLIGLNFSRVFGALFLLLAADGRLSGPFPYSAAWGDIATGLLALPVAWYAARQPRRHSALTIGAWNLFGAADLVVAVALGLTSADGSPLQLFHGGAGSAAMQTLPWSLVPTVLAPFYLILHGVIFAQLRAQSPSCSRPGVEFARGAA